MDEIGNWTSRSIINKIIVHTITMIILIQAPEDPYHNIIPPHLPPYLFMKK